MPHPDLHAEQSHLDRALARLEAVRAQTQEQLKEPFGRGAAPFSPLPSATSGSAQPQPS